MSYRVALTPLAAHDLYQITVYVAESLSAAQTAVALLDRLQKAIDNLAYFPRRNELVDGAVWSRRGLRKMVVDNYLVFYLVDEKRRSVEVLRVMYAKRDYNKVLNEMTKEESVSKTKKTGRKW